MNFEEAIKDFPKRNIAVIGDVMLDEYLIGTADRISPEAPVPVVSIRRREQRLGGAANVANNVAALGANAILVSVTGMDEAADKLDVAANDSGIKFEFIRDSSRPTSRKTRVLAVRQQIVRVDEESTNPIDNKIADQLVESMFRYAPLDAIVVSDYNKGVVTPYLAERMSAIAREHATPIFVDPKGRDFKKYNDATFVTPNRKEAEYATGISVSHPSDFYKVVRNLFFATGAQHIVITLGQDGMVLAHRDSDALHHVHAVAREVFDVTGAGDTVIAVLALSYSSGLSSMESVALANLAAGRVVGKIGTSSLTRIELLSEVMNSGVTLLDYFENDDLILS